VASPGSGSALARIYGGLHFPTVVEEGAKQDKKIAEWVHPERQDWNP
jgi:hypothetical protein